jgi:hypothetical protein
MASFAERMIGAAMLNPATYEEVEHDSNATAQAMLVVVMAAIAGAVGASRRGDAAVVIAVLQAVGWWVLWAMVTYAIGTGVFKGTATWGELLRTIGFAQTPAILNGLGFIPLLGGLVRFATGIWVLLAVVLAIRQALDVDTGKAVLTALIGFAVVVAFTIALTVTAAVLVAIFGFLIFW